MRAEGAPAMKNIVLCCDGTSNQFSEHNTNVVRLYQTLVKDPARQVAYYHPGLGTMEAVGALTSFARKFTKLLGLAIGYGLEDDIKAASSSSCGPINPATASICSPTRHQGTAVKLPPLLGRPSGAEPRVGACAERR